MRIALIGYGKMGKMIEEVALSRGHEIVSIIDADNQEDFNSKAFASADVAIEFTTPAAAYDNVIKAFNADVKVVSGSTGWMDKHQEDIKKLCTEKGKTLFWASNFSVGVALFSAVNRYLAKIMNDFPQYDVKLDEIHHIHKLDAPSGTAITLAEDVIANLKRKTSWINSEEHKADGTVMKSEQTSQNELAINSYRQGEVSGTHSLIYKSEADTITITHEAQTRKGFAIGAILAAEYTKDHKGLLGINDLFDF